MPAEQAEPMGRLPAGVLRESTYFLGEHFLSNKMLKDASLASIKLFIDKSIRLKAINDLLYDFLYKDIKLF